MLCESMKGCGIKNKKLEYMKTKNLQAASILLWLENSLPRDLPSPQKKKKKKKTKWRFLHPNNIYINKRPSIAVEEIAM